MIHLYVQIIMKKCLTLFKTTNYNYFGFQVVKVGQAGEMARQQAEEAGIQDGPTQELLNDYSTTHNHAGLRTPRTPALTDNVLQVGSC